MRKVCVEDFDAFKEIVQDDDFECSCIRDYEGYLDTVLEFKGTKDDIRIIKSHSQEWLLFTIIKFLFIKNCAFMRSNLIFYFK